MSDDEAAELRKLISGEYWKGLMIQMQTEHAIIQWIDMPEDKQPLEAFAMTLINKHMPLKKVAYLFATHGITLDVERVRKLLVFS